MSPKQLWLAVAAIGIGLVAIVVLLVTAGEETAGTIDDARGDVNVEEDPEAPRDVAAADIIAADVNGDDAKVVFELRLASPAGSRPPGELAVRWDVIEEGEFTWIITADLGSRPVAALTSQRTAYGSSTQDGTLPGDIVIAEDVVRVTIRTQGLRSWPDEFDWRVETTLDPDRGNPQSPVAKDRAPEGGDGHFAP